MFDLNSQAVDKNVHDSGHMFPVKCGGAESLHKSW